MNRTKFITGEYKKPEIIYRVHYHMGGASTSICRSGDSDNLEHNEDLITCPDCLEVLHNRDVNVPIQAVEVEPSDYSELGEFTAETAEENSRSHENGLLNRVREQILDCLRNIRHRSDMGFRFATWFCSHYHQCGAAVTREPMSGLIEALEDRGFRVTILNDGTEDAHLMIRWGNEEV